MIAIGQQIAVPKAKANRLRPLQVSRIWIGPQRGLGTPATTTRSGSRSGARYLPVAAQRKLKGVASFVSSRLVA